MAHSFPADWQKWRVGLCHDWLTGMRGGERVLEILGEGFPRARLYTLLHRPEAVSEVINDRPISTSFLQRLPGIHRYYRGFLPLMPLAIRSLEMYDADLLISTSHCVAKGLRPAHRRTRHLCYCFTPMRYAWLFHEEYFGANRLKRAALAPLLAALRRWDLAASDRVDSFVAISRAVRDRIRTFYGREASVVYPPANTDYFTPDGAPPDAFDLVVSALVPYKKIDLAVEAYRSLPDRQLRIIGAGTEYRRLRARAPANVQFLGRLDDAEVRGHLRRCRLLVFPGEEDFGIVPVEAMACGRPVVAFGRGGVTETVVHARTGLFFAEQTPAALADAVAQAALTHWDAEEIRRRAEEFSIPRFIAEFDLAIRNCLDGPRFRSTLKGTRHAN
jgi:glycosyltransferase involved in cell wall biosynthesis